MFGVISAVQRHAVMDYKEVSALSQYSPSQVKGHTTIRVATRSDSPTSKGGEVLEPTVTTSFLVVLGDCSGDLGGIGLLSSDMVEFDVVCLRPQSVVAC